ncbi:hypothetical protein J2X97_000788 [Epilithonimonas hungarica]|nr:hypothetical protein [Epilithonimonas hungarica]MDP9955151.1 hypothetical protein [Epilithonimonas hungarica]
MKTLKIYTIITTLAIIGLSIWIYSLKKELQETEEILEMCSDRYYKEISK